MVKNFFIIFLFSIIIAQPIKARDFIGFGIHSGLQYDVGNLGAMNNIDYIGQHSAIAGISIKIDSTPFFFRAGADRSIMIAKGKVLNSSAGKLQELKIEYTSIPTYAGLNFKIRERGKFYIGFGDVYIVGSGKIKTTDREENINKNVFGLGILTGIQLRVGINTKVYAEWEYISAKTEPVVNISTGNSYKDFSIDFTGHRIHFGFSYYIL